MHKLTGKKINTSQQRFCFWHGFLSDMPVCSSSSGTREQDESIITVMSPKYESTDDSFGNEDSLQSAESDHNDVWR